MHFFCFIFSILNFFSPTDSTIIVQEIHIVGNQKTKENIILRELDFAVSDTLQTEDLTKRLELNRRKIFNTNLFNSVEIKSEIKNNYLIINIIVQEQWYLLGYPVFDIADRNLNEWWQRGHQFNRTIYGFSLSHNNLRGRAEKLSLYLISGFIQRADVSYRIPYIDKSQRTGIEMRVSYATNNNLAYSTFNDTLAYRKSDDILQKRFFARIAIRKRYHFYDNHSLELRYNANQIADTIARLNPNYFLENRTSQKYFQLTYYFNYDFRDNAPYPLRGNRYELIISKLGILPNDNINLIDISATYSGYKQLGRKIFFQTVLEGKISSPNNQPFFNTRGLGYQNDLVRGYELYAIDGQAYLYARNTLKYELLNTKARLKFLKIKQFSTIPIALYPNIYADAGYVSNNFTERNRSNLANKWLTGIGVGLDIVTYYNVVMRFNYVLNQKNERGFVFNIGREF
jgi:outer membrane protein assembly factor BamA